MKQLRKFLALRSADQGLLLLAGLLLATTKLTLRWLPLPVVLCILKSSKKARIGSHPSMSYSPFRAIQAVEVASRHMPGGSSCLIRAITVQALLGRQGCPTQLQIGVGRTTDGRFIAHAWIESHGQIVTGNREDLDVYRVLRPRTVDRS